MKRFVSLVLALAMIMSLSISAFASDHSSSAIDDDISIDVLPSPIAVLREDPNEACGISSHRPPAGYRYVGSTSGNSQVELVVTAIGCNLVGLIPGLGTLMPFLSWKNVSMTIFFTDAIINTNGPTARTIGIILCG